MLVILKIPVVYLCLVVWWAIRAEPRPPEPAVTTARAEPEPPPGWRFSLQRPRRPRRGPHGTPSRGYRRKVAHAEAPR
jgi:hypothetical protein